MLTVLGLLPGILFCILFLIQDKHITKKKLIIYFLLLIFGALGSYVCYRIEMHVGSYFKRVAESNWFEILFYAIFGVAIFEEGYKWFYTFLCSFLKKRNYYDMVLYAVFCSIGFATFENVVYYAIPYGVEVLKRMITAFPSHIFNALWMGYFFEKYCQEKEKKRYLFLLFSLIVPILVHALYNSFLYGGMYDEFFPCFYGFYVSISIILFFSMRNNHS